MGGSHYPTLSRGRLESDVALANWPDERLERVLACPACGSLRRETVYDDLTDTVLRRAAVTWQMHRCEGCGSHFLDPRPDVHSIGSAYAGYFTHDEPIVGNPNPAASGLHAVRRALANGYRNWRYGTRDRPASMFGPVVAWAVPRLRHAADVGMRFLPRRSTGRRLLDVGAGNGGYLLRARAAGWEGVGVETDPVAVKVARRAGLLVHQGGIECLASAAGNFDVITMNHVIEHVHDPRAVLSVALRLLRPGGQLYLETPNADSALHQRFGRHWRGLEPPRHLVLFTWNSIEALLREVGYRPIKRLPRPGAYATLLIKSRAIQRGADPESAGDVSLSVRVESALHEAAMAFNHRRREFVALLAMKP